jgi:hypothetical protein
MVVINELSKSLPDQRTGFSILSIIFHHPLGDSQFLVQTIDWNYLDEESGTSSAENA